MDFNRAVSVAEENAKKLLPGAKNFTLEGVVIVKGNYEVTLSYFLSGKDPLELTGESSSDSNMFKLARLMGTRRDYKVFIVDKDNFSFKGFKAYKEG